VRERERGEGRRVTKKGGREVYREGKREG